MSPIRCEMLNDECARAYKGEMAGEDLSKAHSRAIRYSSSDFCESSASFLLILGINLKPCSSPLSVP